MEEAPDQSQEALNLAPDGSINPEEMDEWIAAQEWITVPVDYFSELPFTRPQQELLKRFLTVVSSDLLIALFSEGIKLTNASGITTYYLDEMLFDCNKPEEQLMREFGERLGWHVLHEDKPTEVTGQSSVLPKTAIIGKATVAFMFQGHCDIPVRTDVSSMTVGELQMLMSAVKEFEIMFGDLILEAGAIIRISREPIVQKGPIDWSADSPIIDLEVGGDYDAAVSRLTEALEDHGQPAVRAVTQTTDSAVASAEREAPERTRRRSQAEMDKIPKKAPFDIRSTQTIYQRHPYAVVGTIVAGVTALITTIDIKDSNIIPTPVIIKPVSKQKEARIPSVKCWDEITHETHGRVYSILCEADGRSIETSVHNREEIEQAISSGNSPVTAKVVLPNLMGDYRCGATFQTGRNAFLDDEGKPTFAKSVVTGQADRSRLSSRIKARNAEIIKCDIMRRPKK